MLVRQGDSIRVYLGGKLEISGESPIQYSPHFETLYVGGRNDKKFCFEGRIDEVAVYNRAMTSDQITIASRHDSASAVLLDFFAPVAER